MERWALVVFSLVSGVALAHDLWFDNERSGYVLLQGHRHSGHDGAEVIPYAPSAVKGFTCIDSAGGVRPLTSAGGYPARIVGDCTTLMVRFSTGYWTKTPWETRNVPKIGIAGVVKSWYSEESLKLVERWTSVSSTPIGSGLEITPTTNPLTLKAGDKLVVLVTDDGKPAPGVPVAYGGDTRGASGADGKVAIRLRRGGLQLLEATQETPLGDGKADSAIRTASIQFKLAP